MTRPFLLACLLCLCSCGSLVDAGGRPDVRTIGPAGGKVVSRDGRFALEVPAGALDRQVTVAVSASQSPDPHVAGPLYAVAPVGLDLGAPARLTLSPAVTPSYGRPPSLGRVMPDGSWEPISGSTYEDGAIVDGSIIRLEIFAAWVYCSGDAMCAGGTVCLSDHTCGRECTGDGDCAAGQVCQAARCALPCQDLCASSADCGPDATCDPGPEGCTSCVAHCTDADGDGYFAGPGCGTAVDCNDADPAIHPGATETCDGADDDCNDIVDDACPGGAICYQGSCP